MNLEHARSEKLAHLNLRLPSLDEITAICAGDHIKVAVVSGNDTERFWAEVLDVADVASLSFRAVVVNDTVIAGYAIGDELVVEYGQVLDIMDGFARRYELKDGSTEDELCRDIGQSLLALWMSHSPSDGIAGAEVVDLISELFERHGTFSE